jgi:hypothetical protein
MSEKLGGPYDDWRAYINIKLRKLANEMRWAAHDLRETKNKACKAKAVQLKGAEKLVREWARQVTREAK